MNIGITGANGLIGRHLRDFLCLRGGHNVRFATRPILPIRMDSPCLAFSNSIQADRDTA